MVKRCNLLTMVHILITVTRLNNKQFTINAIFIETVESFPDTTISLTNGRKFVVKESEQEIVQRVSDFYQSVSLIGTRLLEENKYEE